MAYTFTDDELAAQAAKKNARLAAKYPLLAHSGQLETITTEDVRERWARINTRMDDALARIETHAREYAAEVFEKLGADETALLYAYRCVVLPKSVEYDADFWHGILKRLNNGTYAQWRESLRFVFEGKVAKWLNNLTGE